MPFVATGAAGHFIPAAMSVALPHRLTLLPYFVERSDPGIAHDLFALPVLIAARHGAIGKDAHPSLKLTTTHSPRRRHHHRALLRRDGQRTSAPSRGRFDDGVAGEVHPAVEERFHVEQRFAGLYEAGHDPRQAAAAPLALGEQPLKIARDR